MGNADLDVQSNCMSTQQWMSMPNQCHHHGGGRVDAITACAAPEGLLARGRAWRTLKARIADGQHACTASNQGILLLYRAGQHRLLNEQNRTTGQGRTLELVKGRTC